MKQKVVVNVTMNDPKSRSKALKIAVGLSGVESASLKGDEYSSQIEVTGDGFDPVRLTSLLRKSMRHAELVSVSSAAAGGGEKKKDEEKPAPAPAPAPANVYTYNYPPPHYYYYYVYEVPSYGYAHDHHEYSSCFIL